MGNVEKQVAEEVADGQAESGEDRGQVEGLLEPVHPLHLFDFKFHHSSQTKIRITAAVATVLASESGRSFFQPRAMVWSNRNFGTVQRS